MPGRGALNKDGNAGVSVVSCAWAGNCAAGGFYTGGHRHLQGFVAVVGDGVWGKAIQVPGLGALSKGGNARVLSVSCASAGNCSVGGDYVDRSFNAEGFVAAERYGVWGRAIEVPRLAALNAGGVAVVSSVSCTSAGNCSAGGCYWPHFDVGEGFGTAADLLATLRRSARRLW